MGNAPGKLGAAMVCDGGNMAPNGIYAGDAQDFDVKVVQRLIVARRMAPFYVGGDEPDPADSSGEGASPDAAAGQAADDGWWSYNLVLAQQQKELEQAEAESRSADTHGSQQGKGHARKGSGLLHRLRTPHSGAAEHHLADSEAVPGNHGVRHERSVSDMTLDADACRLLPLRRYIECPICFLYYPRNINYTRCCHKPICTECFVQIKRKLEDSHIVPTHCPYCVQPNLGIVYYAPAAPVDPHRPAAGARAPTAPPRIHSSSVSPPLLPRSLGAGNRSRSQSSACPQTSSADPLIVMSDDIRPALVRDLHARLDARRKRQLRSAQNMALVAAATRRASALEHARQARASGSPRSSRSPSLSHDNSEYARYLFTLQAAGQGNIEEFMFQEAIRA
ncbi:SNF1-interacting protein, partial [Coemansia biformis]